MVFTIFYFSTAKIIQNSQKHCSHEESSSVIFFRSYVMVVRCCDTMSLESCPLIALKVRFTQIFLLEQCRAHLEIYNFEVFILTNTFKSPLFCPVASSLNYIYAQPGLE